MNCGFAYYIQFCYYFSWGLQRYFEMIFLKAFSSISPSKLFSATLMTVYQKQINFYCARSLKKYLSILVYKIYKYQTFRLYYVQVNIILVETFWLLNNYFSLDSYGWYWYIYKWNIVTSCTKDDFLRYSWITVGSLLWFCEKCSKCQYHLKNIYLSLSMKSIA